MKNLLIAIFVLTFTNVYAQTDSDLFNAFNNAVSNKNAKQGIELYPKVKALIDSKYSFGDTLELNYRFQMFFFAKNNNQINFAAQEMQRLEFLIDKNYTKTKRYPNLMYDLYIFQRDQKNYTECKRILLKTIEDQKNQRIVDSQELAILYSELAFIHSRLGEIDDEIKIYQKAIPLAQKHLTLAYLNDDKYLLANALFDKQRFAEYLILGKECNSYYKNVNQEKNRLSEAINIYKLSVASDSLGNTKEVIDYATEFLDIMANHPELGLDLYIPQSTARLNQLKRDDIAFVVGIWEKNLLFFSARHNLFPDNEGYKEKTAEAYYNVALHSMSFVEENSYEIQKRFDPEKAILKSRLGLEFCKHNNLMNNEYFFLLQEKFIEGLIEYKDPETLPEIRKARKIIKNYYSGDLLKQLKIDVREADYFIKTNEKNEALKLLLEAENKSAKIKSKEFDFLSLQYIIFSDLQDLYMDFGDIKKSQFYLALLEVNQNEQDNYFREHALKHDLNWVEDFSSFSDSLNDLSYNIYQKLENNSAVDIDVNITYNNLNTDLKRTDLTIDDKLELLGILQYICNKSENHVQRKIFLQQETIIRDSLGLWTDSIKISYNISKAHVENDLFDPQLSIEILEQLILDFGIDKILKYNSYNRVINNLSYYYSEIGDFTKSRILLQNELNRLNSLTQNIKKEQLELINKDKILILNNLGELSLHFKEIKNAHQYLKEAFDLSKTYYVSNSMNYLQQLKNYSDLIMFSEFKTEAENLLLEEVELSDKLFSKSDYEYYSSHKQLFMYYFLNGRYDKCDTKYLELVDEFLFTFFENGKGLNNDQFIQYQINFLNEFSMIFDYAINRQNIHPEYLETALNCYFLMTELLDQREEAIRDNSDTHKKLQALKKEYLALLQLPFVNIETYIKMNNLKKGIDSIENNFYLQLNNSVFLNKQLFTDVKDRLPKEAAFVFNILHHELNSSTLSIEQNTAIYNEGNTINYTFVLTNDGKLQFDKYDSVKLDIKAANSDFQNLTRSNGSGFREKSMIISSVFASTLEKLDSTKNVYVYPTDYLSWLNLDVLTEITDGIFEIDKREIVYVTNLNSIGNSKSNFKPRAVTLFGSPEYNLPVDYHNQIKNNGTIGIGFDMERIESDRKVYLSNVIPELPASLAGLKIGDQIISIDNILIDTLKVILDVYSLLSGEVGSSVKLEFLRDGKKIVKEVFRIDETLLTIPNYGNLPGTFKEVNGIKTILSKQSNINIKSFQGEFATEDNLKNNLNTDILHIATHSFYLNRSETIKKYDLTPINGVYATNYYGNQFFDNGLVFSGVNNLKLDFYNGHFENGFLYAGEIENLNMSKINLVVLSSCESGMANESIFQTTRGLINSLEKAGVKNTIVSLWTVDDNATQEFMTKFYENLFMSTSASAALRKTKIEIKKIHPEPYYWAPFVLYQLN